MYLKSLLRNEFFLSKLLGVAGWSVLALASSLSSSSLTCFKANASFFESLNDPPALDERLFRDFFDILKDWLRSKKELLGDVEDSSPLDDSLADKDFASVLVAKGEFWPSRFPLLSKDESGNYQEEVILEKLVSDRESRNKLEEW